MGFVASHSLVGDTDGSLLATSSHEPAGSARAQYAIVARHWASIEGNEKAGPHTWSCSMADLGEEEQSAGRKLIVTDESRHVLSVYIGGSTSPYNVYSSLEIVTGKYFSFCKTF